MKRMTSRVRGILVLGFTLILLSLCVYSAETTAQPSTHILDNGILRAVVMNPLSLERYNTGTRFASIAAVLQVSRNGHTYLFYPQNHNRADDHAGLAAEFDLCIPGGDSKLLPPGYTAAKVGEGFVKIGVGILEKKSQQYSLFQRNKVLRSAQTTVTWNKDRALFVQTCTGTSGYGYRLQASVLLDKNTLQIDWILKNTGNKRFTTRQYSHNFCRFDQYDSGTGYELGFPYPIQPKGLAVQQELKGQSILFSKPIPQWVNIEVPYPKTADYAGTNWIELKHPAAKMSLKMLVSLSGIYTAIHARTLYISPEQFIELHLEPQQEIRWKRSYTFK